MYRIDDHQPQSHHSPNNIHCNLREDKTFHGGEREKLKEIKFPFLFGSLSRYKNKIHKENLLHEIYQEKNYYFIVMFLICAINNLLGKLQRWVATTGGVSGKGAHKTRRFLFMYNFLQPHYTSPLIPSATAFMRLPILFFLRNHERK